MLSNPEYPIYIPSKSRASSAFTARFLDQIKVPYRLVIEHAQYGMYRDRFPAAKLLVLDPTYQRDYDACGDFEGQSKGSGPARNFIWDHSIAEGHSRHWVMDDNIRYFWRLHRNEKTPVGDGTCFRIMEDFTDRYTNIAMAGPQYEMFALSRTSHPPFTLNTRIFSCILIRNDLPFRWRARYNEDLDLSLRVLKAGWCTVLFYAFLQKKIWTQEVKGGNTEAFYAAEGTLPKSQMLVRLHPDVARLTWKYNRWHHHVDYRPFKDNRLIRRPDYEPPAENPYPLKRIERYSGVRGMRRC
jgi:TET-Associated Glycosyltransferase